MTLLAVSKFHPAEKIQQAYDAGHRSFGESRPQELKAKYDALHDLILSGKVLASYTVKEGGIAAAVSKMAFGNKLGVEISEELDARELFENGLGSIVAEVDADKINLIDCEYTCQ